MIPAIYAQVRPPSVSLFQLDFHPLLIIKDHVERMMLSHLFSFDFVNHRLEMRLGCFYVRYVYRFEDESEKSA